MKTGNVFSLTGGIMGLVSFALPWIAYDDTRYTAYELIADHHFLGRDSAPSFFLLWCLPVGASILILASLLAPKEGMSAQRWNLAGAILGCIALLNVWGQLAFTSAPTSNDSTIPTNSVALSVGSWLATLAFILALSGAIQALRQERLEREEQELAAMRERKELERAHTQEKK